MHRPGKKNNADALSRREYEQQGPTFYPHTEAEETVASLIDNNYEIVTFDYEGDEEQQLNILAITDNTDYDTLEDIDPEQFKKRKTFRHLQRQCPDYVEIFNYKLNGQVPQERQKARQLDAKAFHYEIDNGILYHFFNARSRSLPKGQNMVKQLAIPRTLLKEVLEASMTILLAVTKEKKELMKLEIIARFGAPRCIVSDQGANFLSKFVAALCELLQFKRHYTSAYHPQTNAACERMNSFIVQTLRTQLEKQTDWPNYIAPIMMAYRMTPATQSTQYSPSLWTRNESTY
ncbi:unnamed protein product [Mytilus coruscus]|uniref:Integrase catalytic domain-containing protein n=1 Tax=Mytilus coruscus TaxID=42192 RepID=A0A6J7ZZA6_MYTCO|nr:unnamed protein product [Mytilus coruscus]